MYARVNIIFGRRDKVADGIAQVEETDRVAVEASAGNRGLTTLVDREAGVIVVVSYWDEPASSWASALTRTRADAAAAAGGDLVAESYEVLGQEPGLMPPPDAVVRLERVQLDPAAITAELGFLHDQVLPQVRLGPGFCGAELLLDRVAGDGMLLTTWTGNEEAVWVDTVVAQLREVGAGAGTTFRRPENYLLVRGVVPV